LARPLSYAGSALVSPSSSGQHCRWRDAAETTFGSESIRQSHVDTLTGDGDNTIEGARRRYGIEGGAERIY
jgi:hypothetical protein